MARPTIADRYDEKIAQRMLDYSNQMPGLPAYLGVKLLRFAPGLLEAEADLVAQEATPSGNVHGGVVAGILDHITGAVVYPLIPDGHWGATTELKLNYISPITPEHLRAEASVLAITNRSAVVRAEAFQGERLVAAAQGTIAIVAPRTVVTGASA
ncbi:hypothetical protein DSM112329_00743 [Paraconexibacter sp. AEG42_29]|uniref:Medium/long-chain acyl-CoA thioesterase YigI n=1 Tax=Paraconexibacter sp. AEG42_29 TaxID=2997339 RepID=A0AAU7AQM6_9ACTN